MEDTLDIYQRPYDPSRPIVSIDETNKQLIFEKRIPCKPGNPEKVDSVYVRNGVADIFMISELLAEKRETIVKQTCTAIDFAEVFRYTADELYPKTEKIIFVADNLNIHAPEPLFIGTSWISLGHKYSTPVIVFGVELAQILGTD